MASLEKITIDVYDGYECCFAGRAVVVEPTEIAGDFYGVHEYMFRVGRYVFEVAEDSQDGYRSSMEQLFVATHLSNSHPEFCRPLPLDRVTVRESSEDCYVYELVGSGGHVWLRFGTASYDDYYPCFVFEYHAKP